jgi:hypothetical protein
VWAHFQYILGLHRLGHEVWFVEEAGWHDSCYDPVANAMTSDPSHGIGVLERLYADFDLPRRWGYRDEDGGWHGIDAEVVAGAFGEADLFLDVGGTSHFPEMAEARVRAYVDMDPFFTQVGQFGGWKIDQYDVLFTYGANTGRDGCSIPAGGHQWRPLRPPVVLDVWDSSPAGAPPPGAAWTTVANWSAYGAVEHGGETFGQKDLEFLRVAELPSTTDVTLELATAGPDVPRELLERHGWRLRDPRAVTSDHWTYRDYIWSSRGEFSVAKNAYVKSRSGWFSDRTAAYLASGRPAVVQDTGLGQELAGPGLVLFSSLEDAAAALAAVEAGYDEHARGARALAVEHFDASKVLVGMLDAAVV